MLLEDPAAPTSLPTDLSPSQPSQLLAHSTFLLLALCSSAELLLLLEDPTALDAKVEEAVSVLKQHDAIPGACGGWVPSCVWAVRWRLRRCVCGQHKVNIIVYLGPPPTHPPPPFPPCSWRPRPREGCGPGLSSSPRQAPQPRRQPRWTGSRRSCGGLKYGGARAAARAPRQKTATAISQIKKHRATLTTWALPLATPLPSRPVCTAHFGWSTGIGDGWSRGGGSAPRLLCRGPLAPRRRHRCNPLAAINSVCCALVHGSWRMCFHAPEPEKQRRKTRARAR